jgi:hypothetical protein
MAGLGPERLFAVERTAQVDPERPFFVGDYIGRLRSKAGVRSGRRDRAVRLSRPQSTDLKAPKPVGERIVNRGQCVERCRR